MKQRILNWLISLDQFLFNTLTLGHSSPDETLSAAAWRWGRAGKLRGRILCPLIDALFLPFERNHCEAAYLSEKRGLHLPPEYQSEVQT